MPEQSLNPGKPSEAKKLLKRKLEPVLANQAPARQRNQKTHVRKAHLPHCSCCSVRPQPLAQLQLRKGQAEHETARVHRRARWRGGVAARSKGAAAGGSRRRL